MLRFLGSQSDKKETHENTTVLRQEADFTPRNIANMTGFRETDFTPDRLISLLIVAMNIRVDMRLDIAKKYARLSNYLTAV